MKINKSSATAVTGSVFALVLFLLFQYVDEIELFKKFNQAEPDSQNPFKEKSVGFSEPVTVKDGTIYVPSEFSEERLQQQEIKAVTFDEKSLQKKQREITELIGQYNDQLADREQRKILEEKFRQVAPEYKQQILARVKQERSEK